MTKQRKLIIGIVNSSRNHPTAAEIYSEARRMMPSIAVGTVYRNLKLLTNAGEIRKLSFPGQPERYDRIEHPHGHLYCVACGGINDFDISPALRDEILAHAGERAISCDVTIDYLCDACAGSK
ncbi:MAG TPA: transcriptional repressor [Bacillota bacterium]|nr:transcriptional repressor [Clostridiales bacterium]HOQ14720.1 transcriptional repressor [Bacillota bacterium]HPU17741.1 transcriptional repressor [Bacillota bacterium]